MVGYFIKGTQIPKKGTGYQWATKLPVVTGAVLLPAGGLGGDDAGDAQAVRQVRADAPILGDQMSLRV